MKIKKILIANRGEIACRIIQTCQKLNIRTVAIYSEIERNARHVQLADEAYLIKAQTPTATYLQIEDILKIAKQTDTDAIHPGYGFLSERSEFAQAIISQGLIFIGAPIAALDLMGSKAAAKKTMIKAGVACVPGYHGDQQESQFLHEKADQISYPLLIKASAGGGGKGMKIVNQSSDFIEALDSAKREALKSFGNDHVILERFITQPKHIEVQVFADSHGNVVHLFERDCSSQRRYQKIIEEAPATCIDNTTKAAMYDAAVAATKAVNYQGAGTIEFIVQDNEFFFMEMNTRLQVEHRVTEMITDTDLVEWQIKVSEGQALPLKQKQIICKGHAIQARIYAEDSFNGFLPATGFLEQVKFSYGQNIIIDTGIEKSNNISIHFDPMIAKTVCWAETRTQCINLVLRNLDQTFIAGVKTNLGFLSALISSEEFDNNTVFTNSLDNASLAIETPKISNPIIATLIHKLSSSTAQSAWSGNNGWSNSGNYSNQYSWIYNEQKLNYSARIVDNTTVNIDNNSISIKPDAYIYNSSNQLQLVVNHKRYHFDKINHLSSGESLDESSLTSPMPGKILEIKVSVGDKIKAEQTLIVMEAMKMELNIKSTTDSIVKSISVKQDDIISANTLLIELE